MDIFKRGLAPVVDEAWAEIEKEAARALRANLSARYVTDVRGPFGLDHAAVNTGRLDIPAAQDAPNVEYGVRRVLPLVELRARFELDVWPLDDAARGARDLDLAAVSDAAERVARFEERAVYLGFPAGGIEGLAQRSDHEPVPLGSDAAQFADAVARGMLTLQEAGVDGPYAVVLGSTPFRLLHATTTVYPPLKQIETLTGGAVRHSPVLEGGFLVSTRGGDFELTIGQDVALGYETHDSRRVRLYLTESFTFRVLEPSAVLPLSFS